MVCVAAFIILCLISIFVAILSIFRRDIGKKYWSTFKKAWGCVWKKVRLQKCETNFKEDVKNSLLKKVVIKKPKLVKPLSIAIEVVSVLIVLVTIWSLVEVVKGGLSIYAFGTCTPEKPESCVVSGATYCPLETGGNWFTEWGDIFAEIPDKLKKWDASEYLPDPVAYRGNPENPIAIDIFDPGCDKCLASYRTQVSTGFFDSHFVALLPYVIRNEDGGESFNNSELFVRYLAASPEDSWDLLDYLFAKSDSNGASYQYLLKNEYSAEEARETLHIWLEELGHEDFEVSEIAARADSDEISETLKRNAELVENRIRPRGIPTMIYDGKKHTGIYE